MKYLNNFFNDICIKTVQNNKFGTYNMHDGSVFEELIGILLKSMFPDLDWTQTQATNDGNKDFWTSDQGEIIWAECKNFKVPIELKVLAPTLVMAQLSNAKELYFFSVSSIKDNAKKKICFYSLINNKQVHFIEDDLLESLLLTYSDTWTYINKKYDLSFIKLFNKDFLQSPTIYKVFTKNPFLNLMDEDLIFGQSLKEVELNDIISEQIYIINNSTSSTLKVNLKIDVTNKFLYHFEYLEKELKPSDIEKISETLVIQPYGVITRIYNFRINTYVPRIKLPEIEIAYSWDEQNKNVITEKEKYVICQSIGKTKLVGGEYEDIIKKLSKIVNSQKRLISFWCKGGSGVGKTRMLEESLPILLKNHYKILNFIGIVQESSLSIIQEIIYVLYDITDEILEPLFLCYKKYNMIPENIHLVMKLLIELHKVPFDIIKFIDTYGEIIFEKLSSEKYAIIIDNVQYYDIGMCYFIEKLILYCKNVNRNHSIALFLTINEEYISGNAPANRILYLLEKLKSNNIVGVMPAELQGFESGSALIFLKQLLSIKEETFDDCFIDLIKKVNYNPYYIKYFAEYIMSKHTVIKYDTRGSIIKEHSRFIKIVNSFPPQIKESIDEKWRNLINVIDKKNSRCNVNKIQNDLEYCISCLHIFGILSLDELGLLGCKKKYIPILTEFHFVEKKELCGEIKYSFEHDLIEDYFRDAFEDVLYCSLKKLQKKDLGVFSATHPAGYHLIRLSKSNFNLPEVMESIKYGIENEIPYKIFVKYEELSTRALLYCWDKHNSAEECMKYALILCTRMRERFGGDSAYYLFEKFYNMIQKYSCIDVIQINGFADLLFAICENFHHHGYYKKVIGIYKKYLSAYEELQEQMPQTDETLLNNIAFIYNRITIAYVHFNDYESRKKRDQYMKKSLDISCHLKNRQYYAESLYDNAEFFYYHKEDKKTFIELCTESCNEVDKHHIELMTLHNIQRKIRLCFIKMERSIIPKLIEDGFDYLDSGAYNEYRFFFSKFFHTAKAMYYLIEGNNLEKASKEIYLSIRDTQLFGSTDFVFNQMLMGKIYYLQKKYEKSYEEYSAAYKFVYSSDMVEKNFILEILADELLTRFTFFSDMSFSFLSEYDKERLQLIQNMSDVEYKKFLNQYKAKTIITSDDDTENYPSI